MVKFRKKKSIFLLTETSGSSGSSLHGGSMGLRYDSSVLKALGTQLGQRVGKTKHSPRHGSQTMISQSSRSNESGSHSNYPIFIYQ
jgi:hypothetical protein